MSHQVALAFEDGVTRFIRCDPDQTVADASYRARINIPLDCRDGACGTCKALCESGDYDGGTYIDDALTAEESDQGYVLPCSMRPRTDLVLQIASTSAIAKTEAATFEATVTGLERLSPTTVSLTLETPKRDQLVFLPGQYVNIAVPGTEESRSYSFSNGPDDEALTFLVKLTPGGVMSTWLTERASVGDAVSFTGPNGSFFLRETERPVLLLSGGTGLAPILAILRKLRDDGNERPVHLVHGVSADDDLVELDTLREIAADLPGFTWDHCVSDPGSSAEHRGYVTTLIRPEHLHDGDVAVYLCGPPAMVESVRQHFASAELEPTGFYYEKFALTGPAPVVDDDSVESEPAADDEPQGSLVGDAEPLLELASRSHARQEVFPARDLAPVGAGAVAASADTTLREVARQRVFPGGSPEAGQDLDRGDGPVLGGATRNIARQVPFPALHSPAEASPTGAGTTPAEPGSTYEIGEEHPPVQQSDAIFEAREALELGAVDLVLGRLSSRQLAGYRLLAESTTPYVDGSRFTDAAAYTEANAAFHDYLFTLTGNEHLLRAYQALGVKGQMETVLRHATWCHPLCAQDHLDIVTAFEQGERESARALISAHADRSKLTMRRAMRDAARQDRPAFVTPGRYAGRVVVVTGAAQGIGERVARRVSAEGGLVVLADRSELVEELAEELRVDGGESAAVVSDLETWAGAETVVDAAVAAFGRIDVAIHTVGGTIWAKPFHEYPPEQIQAEINRSLWPALWASRAVLPHLVAQGHGTILNVSSVATRGVNRVPYAAAKGGVNAITSALALEAAPHGVRVVATAPGGTEAPPRRIPRGPGADSAQEKDWYQSIVDQTVESSLMKRYGTLDEQAAAITFLASDEASYITGTVLPVAGGDLG